MSMWGRYIPVRERRAKAGKKMEKLIKDGLKVQPVIVEGRVITKKFWGKLWCKHIESFSDYSNRLPRGRTYIRNGSVCHLAIQNGAIEALVSGSEIYRVTVKIAPLAENFWESIKKRCSGQIGSLLELLSGKLSQSIMEIVADHHEGLFPKNKEIEYGCSCPDWAGMCKHVAAVLYGIGCRLDEQPELLFALRNVDASQLIDARSVTQAAGERDAILEDEQLSSLFGIEMDIEDRMKLSTGIKQKSERPPKKEKNQKISYNFETLTGRQLKKIRAEKKMTISDFAQAIGASPASVYNWEKNPKKLNLQIRFKNRLQEWLSKSTD